MERWSGPFANPNIAGLELALVALAATALAARPASGTVWRIAALGVGLAAIAGLAATGSRAGGLALGCGILVLAALRAVPWRWALTGMGIAAVAFVLSGTGGRFLPVGPDRSLGARLDLWQSTLALITDHPMGIGSGLAAMLNDWYLPAGMRRRYATALNETLTAAALWGLPALGAVVAAITVLVVRAAERARQGDVLAVIAVGLATVHLIAGQFQAHVFAPWSTARWSGAAVVVLLAVAAWRSRCGWQPLALTATAAGLLVPLTLLLAAYGWGDAAWRTRYDAGVLIAAPRHAEPAGLVCVPSHPEEQHVIRDTLAPLLFAERLALAMPSQPWLPHLRTTPTLICATGDMGLQVWQRWRDGTLPADIDVAVIDPDGWPDQPGFAGAERGRLLVAPLAGTSIPDPHAVAEALREDHRLGSATLLPPIASSAWPSVWPAVAAWWRTLPERKSVP